MRFLLLYPRLGLVLFLAVIWLALSAAMACAGDPRFEVRNNCPPRFTVVNRLPAKTSPACPCGPSCACPAGVCPSACPATSAPAESVLWLVNGRLVSLPKGQTPAGSAPATFSGSSCANGQCSAPTFRSSSPRLFAFPRK